MMSPPRPASRDAAYDSCHTNRATGITTYLQNGGRIDHSITGLLWLDAEEPNQACRKRRLMPPFNPSRTMASRWITMPGDLFVLLPGEKRPSQTKLTSGIAGRSHRPAPMLEITWLGE
jgi:hypothetical protein